ncbi:uncharacterized protein LOC131690813 isoform X3 [Topomyia yanbarensis]|uniref:uncharacterized protein LOC131690813 isoform X3 n=1 Tax=Topomyia yanbarensis TaxID=2498891 RepID=UPI00273BF296|nr:uncharacterized protein LOC131690813 isoform X3 [Topomyia yanbarensis]
MGEFIIIPIVTLLLVFTIISVYSFIKRYRKIQKLQAQAPTTDNSAIIYTIPTNQPTNQTHRTETGSAILYPHRTTTYNLRPVSTDLPPSYEDVTKTTTTTTTTTTT